VSSLAQDKSSRTVVTTDEFFFILDREGRVAGCRCPEDVVLPVPPAESIIGGSFRDLLPPPLVETLEAALRSLHASGKPQSVTFQVDIGESRRRFAGTVARLTLAGAGVCTLAMARDVTAHSLAQQAGVESEASYRLLAENTSDVISVKALDGTYLYVSPSVERLTGFSSEEVVGKPAAHLWHPEDLQDVLASSAAGNFAPERGGGRLRHRVRHKEGHWIWVESDVRLFEWRGKPAVLYDTRDISRRQAVEDRAANMLLELQEARSRAEAANQAKSKFLAGMSHALRTPLHGILGMADLLSQTYQTEEQTQYLGAIQESGRALLALLNDLQDLSKIEEGQLDLAATTFDLIEAVEGLADIMGSQATTKGIELNCHVAPGVPAVVVGDDQRLRQVLMNLVGAVLRYSEGGRIDVQVQRLQDDGVRFLVRNAGDRDPSAGAAHPSGDSVQPTSARWDSGTGLGLTLASRLVDLMGGELRAESEGGTHTVFSFVLRFPVADAVFRVPSAELLLGSRVLICDGNSTTRQWMREVVEQAGAAVDVTSGGVEVIRTLQDEPYYQCLILDESMPDIDGLAVAGIVRGDPRFSDLPLVLVAVPDTAVAARRREDLGSLAVLAKPVHRDVLLRAVHTVVTGERFVDELAPASFDGTVLVVEDNDVNMRLARDLLRRAGYRVVTARDGQGALEQLERHPVDAVLMDIQLPDMDGLEATARIRERPAWLGIPIIAMTAHAMKGDAERFIQAGLDDVLSKPVERKVLLGALAREIGKRRCAAAL
jgi:PAS domain S-box-containing protein